MSSTFFDAGDMSRLDRERSLTEEAPRALPSEDKSPVEDNLVIQDEFQDEPEEDGFDLLLEGILEALRRRL